MTHFNHLYGIIHYFYTNHNTPGKDTNLLEDLNYIIKQEDLFYNSEFDTEFRKIGFTFSTKIIVLGLIYYTIQIKLGDNWKSGAFSGYIIASKNEIKPRFPCNKPYPYGY